jgi:hypothetical protein
MAGLCAVALLALAPAASANDPASPMTSAEQPASAAIERIRMRKEREIRRSHEDARTAMGLSAEEYERLILLLVERQMQVTVKRVGAKPAASTAVADTRARIEAEFGSRRAVLFDEYERTLVARQEVETLRATLESAGLPISESQRRELIHAAIAADRDRRDVQINGGEPLEVTNRKLLAFIEERDRRFLPVVRALLSAAQAERYEAFAAERRAQFEGFVRSPPRKKESR